MALPCHKGMWYNSFMKGAEPGAAVLTGANAMAMSLACGERVTLSKVDAFADGVAVKQACLLYPCLSWLHCSLSARWQEAGSHQQHAPRL